MCDICLHYPCLSKCPNYTPKPITICSSCEEELYEYDEVFDIDDEIYCTECGYDWLNQFRKTLEPEV